MISKPYFLSTDMDSLDSDLLKQLEAEEEELFPPLRLDQDFSTVIVICGLPIVSREKEAKFVPLIRDILLKVTVESTKEAVQIKDLWMPFKESPDESKGCVVSSIVFHSTICCFVRSVPTSY